MACLKIFPWDFCLSMEKKGIACFFFLFFLYFNIHPANGVNQDQNQDLQDQEGD